MKDFAPSAERNRDEILGALRPLLPDEGTILEIASGTGQHAVHFAPHFPGSRWQPSEARPEALASIRAWADEAGLPNLSDPLELDVTWEQWPLDEASALVAINMLHISPWAACEGLFAGAARILLPGAPLVYYGAFLLAGCETAPSNLAFDASLRARDPEWGVRRFEKVRDVAEAAGLSVSSLEPMPNNNFLLVARQGRAGS